MSLVVKVIAKTQEVGKSRVCGDGHLFTFGGKMAGVCYMAEDYFDAKIQNTEAANKRAKLVCGSGHHSVFDHAFITLQISGLPKIMAMLLNSIEFYNTSEKSARYTVMQPETSLELEKYNKWKEKFSDVIKDMYPEIDEKQRKKLAQENARYLISVFTPTHMVWTVSYRQLAYVIGWLNDIGNSSLSLDGLFNTKFGSSCLELREELCKITKSHTHIKDNKGRGFEFMPIQNGYKGGLLTREYIGDMYKISYLASFASLAQLQRHRTIHYEMQFKGENAGEYGCYVPECIAGTELEAEWLADFKQVAYCFPQGTLVKVVESGRTEKFIEKCKERLCGRAQLETMIICKDVMSKMLKNKTNMSDKTSCELDKATNNGKKVVSKCRIKGVKCTEHCMWTSVNALNRKI